MNTGPFQDGGIGLNEGPQNLMYLLHGKSAFKNEPEPELWPWEQY